MPKKKVILLVEDDQPIVSVIKSQLEEAGFSLLLAPDGQKGLATALKSHPDLILLDIIMPKMDGITMLRKLRDDKWGKSAKVIMLTNLASPVSERETVALNAVDYLIKTDTDLADVVKKIKKVL